MGKHRTIVQTMNISFNESTLNEILNEWGYCVRASLMDLVAFQNTGCLPNPEENLNFKNPSEFLNSLEKVQEILEKYMDSFYHCSSSLERSQYGVYPAIVAGLKLDAYQCQKKTKAYMSAIAT